MRRAKEVRGGARGTGELVVRRSSAGLGLYTARRIRKGERVIEYTGTLLRADIGYAGGGRYLFEVNRNWVIDGTGRENLSRYINHACKPNCEPIVRGHRIVIYARRPIAAGEELTYDYGKEYFDEYIKPNGCRCAACAGGGP